MVLRWATSMTSSLPNTVYIRAWLCLCRTGVEFKRWISCRPQRARWKLRRNKQKRTLQSLLVKRARLLPSKAPPAHNGASCSLPASRTAKSLDSGILTARRPSACSEQKPLSCLTATGSPGGRSHRPGRAVNRSTGCTTSPRWRCATSAPWAVEWTGGAPSSPQTSTPTTTPSCGGSSTPCTSRYSSGAWMQAS